MDAAAAAALTFALVGREGLVMSYVSSVLQPDEKVRYATNVHWIIYLPGAALLLLGALTYGISRNPIGPAWLWYWIAVLLVLIAAVLLFRAWFRRWTTEIAVTSRRIIRKEGFIRRKTKEIALDKVESVDVDQSIAGRILDYGNVLIHGTGQAIEDLELIARPIQFRNHVTAD
jgi:uncharacterized membrane protein YdbT with pleckstrin-like domain